MALRGRIPQTAPPAHPGGAPGGVRSDGDTVSHFGVFISKGKCGCRQNKMLASARDRAMAELAQERVARERDAAIATARAATAQGDLGILRAQAMPP